MRIHIQESDLGKKIQRDDDDCFLVKEAKESVSWNVDVRNQDRGKKLQERIKRNDKCCFSGCHDLFVQRPPLYYTLVTSDCRHQMGWGEVALGVNKKSSNI